jgi:hypothetical protein
MIELKTQVNELCRRLGEPPKFEADFKERKQGKT